MWPRQPALFALIFLLITVLLACQPGRASPTLQPGEVEVPFETIALSEGGGVVKKPERDVGPQLRLLTTPDEVYELQGRIADEDFAKLQQVDYQQYVIIALLRGRKPTLNYQTIIERITQQGNNLVVHAQLWEPNPVYGAGEGVTAPYHLIKVLRQYIQSPQIKLKPAYILTTPTPPKGS